jgi:hypothetical protein
MARCGLQAHGCACHSETALGFSSEELGGARSPGAAEVDHDAPEIPPVNATPDDPLFPSATGRPHGAMLEKLKAVAWRGKLNCGYCAVPQEPKDGSIRINRCKEGPFCGRWFLHKFRHTYRDQAPAGRYRHSHAPAMDGAPRYRIDDGLSEGRQEQRHSGAVEYKVVWPLSPEE